MFTLLLLFFAPLIVDRTIEGQRITYKVHPDFYERFVHSDLWVEYPEGIDLHSIPSPILDAPCIVNMMPMVWLSGKEYTVEEMDEDLYHAQAKIKEVFKAYHCNTSWEGQIHSTKLTPHRVQGTKTAQLFSCGVDAVASCFAQWQNRPKLILYLHQNYHKDGVVQKYVTKFAKTYDLDLTTIRSNFRQFYHAKVLEKLSADIQCWDEDVIQGMGFAGLASPYLFHEGMGEIWIGSSLCWRSAPYPHGQSLRNGSFPTIDENLIIAGIIPIHHGFDLTRPKKIAFIDHCCKQYALPKPKLHVCAHPQGYNCLKCEKCLRTLNACLSVGIDPREYGFAASKTFVEKISKEILPHLRFSRSEVCSFHEENQEAMRQFGLTPYFRWYCSLNFWQKLAEKPRPKRVPPFTWSDVGL